MYLLLIMIKNITCLGHTSLLIIFWALWPLNIVIIHYLKWAFKTWGVTIAGSNMKQEYPDIELCTSMY
jgi:hypothetical protein